MIDNYPSYLMLLINLNINDFLKGLCSLNQGRERHIY